MSNEEAVQSATKKGCRFSATAGMLRHWVPGKAINGVPLEVGEGGMRFRERWCSCRIHRLGEGSVGFRA